MDGDITYITIEEAYLDKDSQWEVSLVTYKLEVGNDG